MKPLLPGIANDITLDHITPKLPWRTLHVMSCVSRRWQRAIKRRLVYDARVRAHSTVTLIVHNHYYGATRPVREVLALYSTRDERCYELPPIPRLPRGIPSFCQCISLDGKIYVLGGDAPLLGFFDDPSAYLYVLDVAGHTGWKRRASMEEGRHKFAAGVVEGKIYVFGGANDSGQPARGCEVYDPKVNAWSPIKPMPSLRDGHQVVAVGEELFVCGGEIFVPDYYPYSVDTLSHLKHESFFEVYNTSKDNWRIIDTPGIYDLPVLVAKGSLYRMSHLSIDVYDSDKNSWVKLFTNSFPGIGPIDHVTDLRRIVLCHPQVTRVIDDELFVRVEWSNMNGRRNCGADLLHSKDFENGNKEMGWQKTSCSFEYESFKQGEGSTRVLCAIKL